MNADCQNPAGRQPPRRHHARQPLPRRQAGKRAHGAVVLPRPRPRPAAQARPHRAHVGQEPRRQRRPDAGRGDARHRPVSHRGRAHEPVRRQDRAGVRPRRRPAPWTARRSHSRPGAASPSAGSSAAQRCDFTAVEYWMENYATAGRESEAPNAMWQKRAYGQLAKCAEAQALRMAFPEATGGEPTAEEMEGKTFGNDAARGAEPAPRRAAPLPPSPPRSPRPARRCRSSRPSGTLHRSGASGGWRRSARRGGLEDSKPRSTAGASRWRPTSAPPARSTTPWPTRRRCWPRAARCSWPARRTRSRSRSRARPSRRTRLRAALAGVLSTKHGQEQLDYLRRGIGNNSPEGCIWAAARDA
jgi:hypothetical protein